MPYVIAAACIDETDKSCIEECPVDCIYEGDRKLDINRASGSSPRRCRVGMNHSATPAAPR